MRVLAAVVLTALMALLIDSCGRCDEFPVIVVKMRMDDAGVVTTTVEDGGVMDCEGHVHG
jgi:hypothetical protein